MLKLKTVKTISTPRKINTILLSINRPKLVRMCGYELAAGTSPTDSSHYGSPIIFTRPCSRWSNPNLDFSCLTVFFLSQIFTFWPSGRLTAGYWLLNTHQSSVLHKLLHLLSCYINISEDDTGRISDCSANVVTWLLFTFSWDCSHYNCAILTLKIIIKCPNPPLTPYPFSRVPILLLTKNWGLFQDFPGPPKHFSRTLS